MMAGVGEGFLHMPADLAEGIAFKEKQGQGALLLLA
jgi:hypothetical protein